MGRLEYHSTLTKIVLITYNRNPNMQITPQVCGGYLTDPVHRYEAEKGAFGTLPNRPDCVLCY